MIRGQKYKILHRIGVGVTWYEGYYIGIIEKGRDCPVGSMFDPNFIRLNVSRFEPGFDYPVEIMDIIKIEKVNSISSIPVTNKENRTH